MCHKCAARFDSIQCGDKCTGLGCPIFRALLAREVGVPPDSIRKKTGTFPQPSTARSCDERPLLRNQKSAELENMPKAYNKNCAAPVGQDSNRQAKSLSSNILPATLLAPTFCADHARSKTSKSFRTRILAGRVKKIVRELPLIATGIHPLEPRRIGASAPTVDSRPRCKILKQALITDPFALKGSLPWQR